MIVVFAVLILAGVGLALRVPKFVLGGMIAIFWIGLVLAHLTLPAEHPMLLATGGSWQSWSALAGGIAIIFGYGAVLNVLRRKATAQTAASTSQSGSTFSGAELDRYARHIVLREVGGTGQKRLKAAKVLVVGAGGLGSPALLYLAAAGVGTIGVIDDDVVSISNLQRQVIHKDADIGKPKVFSAEAAIKALNPFVSVRTYNRRLTGTEAAILFGNYDLVLDGSDNFPTRYLVNAAAVTVGKPLISAAITQWEGQISLYDPKNDAPCYACVFPSAPDIGLAPSCSEAGVMGALPGVMGAMMAAEAIKEITGAGLGLRGRILLYDALYGENRVLTVHRRPDCEVCGMH